MKRILIALLVMMTIFSLANAQKQTTIVNDSTGNVKVTVTKGKGKDAKVNVGNTAFSILNIFVKNEMAFERIPSFFSFSSAGTSRSSPVSSAYSDSVIL